MRQSRSHSAALIGAPDARDVVVRYLVDYRIYNRDMIGKAFDEYRIRRIL